VGALYVKPPGRRLALAVPDTAPARLSSKPSFQSSVSFACPADLQSMGRYREICLGLLAGDIPRLFAPLLYDDVLTGDVIQGHRKRWTGFETAIT